MRTRLATHSLTASVLIAGLVAAISPDMARAQPYPTPDTWGGEILSRPRLTGDWGGLRDDLAKKGVVLDVDLLATPQAVASGGRSTGANFWGNIDYTLNIDTQKLGLWPGGFFKFEGDTGFGSNVFSDAGAIAPVNTAALLPTPNDGTSALTNATLTQFLSPHFGVFAGKIDTLDLGMTEFHGDYRTQFQNLALNFPLAFNNQIPLSAFGGGVIVLPRENILLSAMALDSNGTPTDNNLGKAFSDGVIFVGSGQLTVKPFGLVGHQSLGFKWSDQQRFSLSQDPSNLARLLLNERFPRLANPGPILTDILTRFFPDLLVPAQPANARAALGVSDGNPNPIQYSFLAGLGGKGVVPGRPDDSFGLGFARTQLSNDFVPFLRQQLSLGLQHEDTVEMYYNTALTPWLNATTYLQIVNPGLTKNPELLIIPASSNARERRYRSRGF